MVLQQKITILCVCIPYFLEIPPPSKPRCTFQKVGPNKRRPWNLTAWYRVVGFNNDDQFADIDSKDEELENNEILVGNH